MGFTLSISTSFVNIWSPPLRVADVSLCRTYRPEPLCSISITETSSLLWAHPRILFACWTSLIQLISAALIE